MVDAVVLELASGNPCPNCKGAGLVSDKACPECRTTGIEPITDRRRALAMGTDSSADTRRWKPVYEWQLAELHQAGEVAMRRFSRVLSNAYWAEQPHAA